jgi:hypothetical protein
MFALLSRSYGEKQTTGCLSIYDEDTEVYQCRTLELPYLENHKNISCIPPGEYKCERITSVKFGLCFLVNDVKDRSNILIHIGNYASEKLILERAIMNSLKKVDTLGCILPGLRFVDINLDGNVDIFDSTLAMGMLLHILPSRFQLIIR